MSKFLDLEGLGYYTTLVKGYCNTKTDWNYTETDFTNIDIVTYENTGVSFTVMANHSVEFYAYDRKRYAYLDSIMICDSNSTLGTTTVISNNSINVTFTDTQYWTLQTNGITPTYDSTVTYYVWVKRKSVGSNPIGLAWRYIDF